MLRGLVTLVLGALALAAAAPAAAGGPTLAIGAAEDWVRAPDLVGASARLTTLRLVGFDSVRITSIWAPGQVAPTESELAVLTAVGQAGRLTGVRVYLSVYNFGSRTTPLTPEAHVEFAAYVAAIARAVPEIGDLIVGNEPNLNRFWLPQFNPDGTNAASAAYLSLLAASYDAAKAANPLVRVWGGALASRGNDRPGTIRDTHSPTVFIRDLGLAYRASGRTLPVMDGIALHPYGGTSDQAPETPHPASTTIGLADYPKLVALLAEAFDGTAQPGSTLPVLYAEYGIESLVPASKAQAYTGQEPATTRPVPEATQASFYERALRLAFCQPTVAGLFLFHTHDEAPLAAWQSGLYYADGTPKASLYPVRDAIARTRGGSIGRCAGLALSVQARELRFPAKADLARGGGRLRLRCTLDCGWTARLLRLPDERAVLARRGYARAGALTVVELGRRLPAGRYHWLLELRHPVNPGTEPTVRDGAPFVLP